MFIDRREAFTTTEKQKDFEVLKKREASKWLLSASLAVRSVLKKEVISKKRKN
jgi:hypothetical protein